MKTNDTNQFDELAKGSAKQTLLKTNLRSQVDFIGITDQKANILLGLNTIMISIIITLGGTQMFMYDDSSRDMNAGILPVFILLITCLVSGIFAIYSVWPKQLQKHKVDQLGILLLTRKYQELDEYLAQMARVLKSNELTYRSITTDIHTVGSFLMHKNRLLQKAYVVFFIGILLAVISFISIWLFNN